MTIRNPGSNRMNSLPSSSRVRSRLQKRKREAVRRVLLETLEQRQLLTTGPMLTGIQPNEGELLFDVRDLDSGTAAGNTVIEGSTLTVNPRELVFRFDDTAEIDPSTLDGIRITRAGADGLFETASATTDFGTDGDVLVEFRSVVTGTAGNGQLVQLSSVNRIGTSLPVITVQDGVVNIELNSNPTRPTRVQDLLVALQSSSEASARVEALLVSGPTLTAIGPTSGARTLTLQGANSAQALSGLGTSDSTLVRFIASVPGPEGRDVTILMTPTNFGGPANPIATVQGSTVRVQFNSTVGFESTVNDVISAINSNPDASRLVTAVLESGTGATRLTNFPGNFAPIELQGAGDEVLTPGYVGLGDSAREVVFRFDNNLPDDTYRIDIIGNGDTALANLDGLAFNGGQNLGIEFDLNLGPQVVAVVPQPVRRSNSTGQLMPQAGIIEVHFNNDDLLPSAARNPNFYQLIFTGSDGSLVPVTPNSVTYSSLRNVAELSFGASLSRIFDPTSTTGEFLSGTYRLRIGTEEALPGGTTTVVLGTDPADTFANATDLTNDLGSLAGGTNSLLVDGSIQNSDLFPFELPGGQDYPGRRELRPEDPSRLIGPIPLDYYRVDANGDLVGDADSEAGITEFYYNFQSSYLGPDPVSSSPKTYFNVITEQQKQRVREVMTLFSEYLGIQFVESESLGTTIVAGDLFSAAGDAVSGEGGLVVAIRPDGVDADRFPDLGVLDFQDFDESIDDDFGGEFSRGAMLLVGQLIGYGLADDLPQPVSQSTDFVLNPSFDTEATYPSIADILHGQYLFRPESADIDLYQFTLDQAGEVTAETFAERAEQTSLLDTALRLYQQQPDGTFEEIAANDDYSSNDSLIRMDLPAGTYILGVSASGNTEYDPTIAGTGFGGVSEGDYQLRLTVRPDQPQGLVDTTGLALDGDADGRPGGVFNFWGNAAEPLNPALRSLELSTPGGPITPATIYVDKAATQAGDGSVARPFREIDLAIAAALPGDIVRIVANGGADGLVSTAEDNLSYQIGVDSLGRTLADGRNLQVPKDVAVVVDAGAIVKFRNAYAAVGSSSPTIDYSGGSLQLLGTPILVESNGQIPTDAQQAPIPGRVIFTSYNDTTVGIGNAPAIATPRPGDWGGIDFRGDLDVADETRVNLEANGIFLNQIYGAELRYGGGQVSVNSSPQVISPIEIDVVRPTVAYTRIMNSAASALEATPDSFTESTFASYVRPGDTGHVSDFSRIGPDLHNLTLDNNSVNGLFIRVRTRSGDVLQPLTTQARFDDLDVVHVLSENLVIQGSPGGPLVEGTIPSSLLIAGSPEAGGTLAAGSYTYRVAFVDANGGASLPSDPMEPVTLAADGSIRLSNIPTVPVSSDFVSRRLYRASVDANGDVVGDFRLAGVLNGTSQTFTDNGSMTGAVLIEQTTPLRARTDGRLVADPGVIIKLDGARIETSFGGQFYAEGTAAQPIIMTGVNDNRFGAAGAFKTDSQSLVDIVRPGDWSGVYVGFAGTGSLDHVNIIGAGGVSRIAGGFSSFNAVEVHQGDLRIVNSRLESNADGRLVDGGDRAGLTPNEAGTIFVRGATPTIANNVFLNGGGAAITTDLNSMSFADNADPGRATGNLDRIDAQGNSGPLIRGNQLSGNDLNGLQVRGGKVATELVWDDTDIVHVVTDAIEVTNQHIYGGLRLESSSDASLVIKFADRLDIPAGIVVGGTLLTAADELNDVADRIGGSLQVIGQPDFPVVMTSLLDDTVGAGFTPEGLAQTDTSAPGFVETLAATTRGSLKLIRPNPTDRATFIGNIGVATDALGTEDTGDLEVTIPTGSVIEAAYLHVASRSFFGPFRPNIIGIDGDDIALTWLDNVDDVAGGGIDFETGRGDVTEQVQRLYAAAGGGLIAVPVDETVTGSAFDTEGTALTVIYSNPNLPIRTAMVLEGGLTNEQFNTLEFSEPIDKTDPNFLAEMRLGISFSTADANTGQLQISEVDVNGQRLTSAAGGFDDGLLQNGALITYGGEGDNPQNPIDPNDGESPDDEYYDLSGFLADGSTLINLRTANPSNDDSIFLSTFLFSGVVGISEPPTPGDWQGVTVREGASDRNVAAVPESETTTLIAPGINGVPGSAQFLGEIAPEARGGDENQRLGFVIDGEIATRDDLDVYSFVGTAGTQVWFDIDRTAMSFDSVVELIDANGHVIASSDNSAAEAAGLSQIFVDESRTDRTSVNSMNSLPLSENTVAAGQDDYSTNPRDAGMRLQLPGEIGTRNLYHVRVRSSNGLAGDTVPNGANSSMVRDGLSKGSYRLQVRLGEVDEFPGTQVRFGDVRFGATNLKIIGQPSDSPLLGDAYEQSADNDTRASAQPIGPFSTAANAANPDAANLAESDDLSLTVAGEISDVADVDWYQFDIDYDGLPASAVSRYLSTVFDLDYADGLSRADMSLFVFNDSGQLILSGFDSNVAEDQPRPGNGSDSTDLSRGSAGTGDPFIGAVEMSEGRYFVAVTNHTRVPAVLNQFYTDPTTGNAVDDPLLRLEPLSSIGRIAEDHINGDAQTADAPGSTDGPQLLFNGTSIVELTLDDLVNYTLSRTGLGNQTALNMNNAFTGTNFGTVGLINPALADFAARPTGEFYGYTQAFNDAGWEYVQISSEDGSINSLGPTNVLTFEEQFDNQGNVVVVGSNDGLQVEALTFLNSDFGYLVANRPPVNQNSGLGPDYTENIVYLFDAATGNLLSDPLTDRAPFTVGGTTVDPRANGAGTQVRERGFIDTLYSSATVNTINFAEASTMRADGTVAFTMGDGDAFAFRDAQGTLYRFEFNSGPDFRMQYNADNGVFIQDGDEITVNGVSYEFETGGSLLVTDGASLSDHSMLTLTAEGTGETRTFELTQSGAVTSGNIPVLYTATMTAGEIAEAIADQIHAADFGITADPLGTTGRIGLEGDSTTTPPAISGVGLTFEGGAGLNSATATEIRLEEGVDFDQFTDAVRQAMINPVSVGVDGDRVNFRGAVAQNNFTVLLNRNIIMSSGSLDGSYGDGTVTPGSTEISFLASDSEATIAERVAAAINNASIGTITASASGRSVVLTNAILNRGEVESAGSPIRLAGVARGGSVTGVAMIGNVMYAVSTGGGLYRVTGLNSVVQGRIGDYVASATDLAGINFTGLSRGPNIDYVDTWTTPGTSTVRSMSNLLFGVASSGRVYAFNTLGVLQPVFGGGATSYATGRGGAVGVEMSTLDYNLWHVTQRREFDAGHGVEADPFGTRGASDGGSSLYFGYSQGDEGRYTPGNASGNRYGQFNRPNARVRADGQQVNNTYNFPGGASGAIESTTFSLAGYAAEDVPVMYFNYLLGTDGVDGTDNGGTGGNLDFDNDSDRDALNIYVVTEEGDSILVATNNSATRAGTTDDALDPVDGADVRLLYDNAGWRQARVPLEAFAGLDNLRLRIEFSTAGQMSNGTLELRTIAGDRLEDGQTVEFNARTLELDLGPVATLPGGVALAEYYDAADAGTPGSAPDARVAIDVDGQTFVLSDGLRTINAGEIEVLMEIADDPLTPEDESKTLSELTASEVTMLLQDAVDANRVPVTTYSGIDFSVEKNDEIAKATTLTRANGDTQITGSGRVGTILSTELNDVDMSRLMLRAGESIDMTVERTAGLLNPRIRLFDANGVQLATSTVVSAGVVNLTYTAAADGVVYIGINGGGDYNPNIGGSGAVGFGGTYDVSLDITAVYETVRVGNLLQFIGYEGAQSSEPTIVSVQGADGVATGNVAVPVRIDMTANEVAAAMQAVLVQAFANGSESAFVLRSNVIELGSTGVVDAGPFTVTGERTGDAFGALGPQRARDNAHEGVFLDDFVIGFAERGELVLNASANDAIVASQEASISSPAQPTDPLVTGTYQLEIRDASEYVSQLSSSYFRTFDTNQRLSANAVSLVLPAAYDVADGETFTLSDGRQTLTFEFDQVGSTGGVGVGNVPIPFDSADSSANSSFDIAEAVVAAINSAPVQNLLDISALLATGVDGAGTTNRVDLIGNVIISNVSADIQVVTSTGRGDSNRDRSAQGVILVENSRFSFASDYGIDISHDTTSTINTQITDSIVRYPRNLVEQNVEGLVPGVVIQSNVIAYSGDGGIRVTGLSDLSSDINSLAFDRIVNNTIVGGSITPQDPADSETIRGLFFELGAVAFADAVVDYNPLAGGGPQPDQEFTNPSTALGVPDYVGVGVEPEDGNATVSLGYGGVLTLAFTDNLLTGDGTSAPDLVVFEVGEIESVSVEVSRDGINYVSVGTVGGLSNSIDIDAFGFTPQDRLAFVRLRDLRQGSASSLTVGADIDAVGALSSVQSDLYLANGNGITVSNAAPTVINNVFANSNVGVAAGANTEGMVVGANAYYRNSQNITGPIGLGQFSDVIPDSISIFVSPTQLVFDPAAGSPIIDSSIDSLPERSSLVSVRGAIGLSPSPILAPRMDVNGQLRVDDPLVDAPGGLGENIFKDRGAADRADLVGPVGRLVMPLDNDAAGLDTNADQNVVSYSGGPVDVFEIQLIDGSAASDPVPGVGIDDNSVTGSSVLVLRDNVPLIEGVDYRFGYQPSNNMIRLTPLSGVWQDDAVYTIRLLDSRDSVIMAKAGDEYADGERLNIVDIDGGVTTFEVETGISLIVPTAGDLPVITDGDTFSIFDGVSNVQFEVDTNDASTPGRVAIPLRSNSTLAEVTSAIATAINGSGLNLSATAGDADRVQLLGPNVLTDVDTLASPFTTEGAVGVNTGYGLQVPTLNGLPNGVVDGETFAIRRGSFQVVNFEIDTGGGLNNAGYIPVTFGSSASLDQIANALVAAISGAGLGLAPTNEGFGRVSLNADSTYVIDLTDSNLELIGSPGQQNAVALPISIATGNAAANVAQTIADTIDAQLINGVSTAVVGDRVIINGAVNVSGSGALTLVTIQDRVGNLLQSNRLDGTTQFTIFLGAGFDYGDAPEPPYSSSLAAGGPRHSIVEGLSLGATVTPDADANPNDSDIDDGVVLLNQVFTGFDATFQIDVQSSTGDAVLDYWVDWNGDGIFSAGEKGARLAVGAGLVVGTNQISIPVPPVGTAADGRPVYSVAGDTFARFRLTTQGIDSPLGDAPDGEVEDHSIAISLNPFQNANGRFDVNASGDVSPIDILQVINALNRSGGTSIQLDPLNPPAGPPYLDVNGDGVVTPIDALAVLNYIERNILGGSGGEGEGRSYVASGSGVMASVGTHLGDASLAGQFDSWSTASLTAEGEAPRDVETGSTTGKQTGGTSVFDSAAEVAVEEVLDSIADRPATAVAEGADEADEFGALDAFFGDLGA